MSDEEELADEMRERLDRQRLMTVSALALPSGTKPRICIVRYPFAGNGPWNYFLEQPPAGVVTVAYVGLYLGEDDRHFLCAGDFAILDDGRIEPIHVKHFGKNISTLELL